VPRPPAVPSPAKPSLPAAESIVRGAERIVALFGRFDLHDADVRAMRLSLGEGNVPALEVDVDLAGASAQPPGKAEAGSDYRVTLRCTDVSQLSLADFGGQNVVSSYTFAPDGVDAAGAEVVHVAITCAPGCDLDLRCTEVAVVAVARLGR